MAADHELPILDGEVVDLDALLDPQPPQHLPAVRRVCACGKDGTPYSHGAIPYLGRTLEPFTCEQVLAIAASIAASRRRGRLLRLFGGAR